MGRTPKTHTDYCQEICIGCLKKPKASFRRPLVLKNGSNVTENLIQSLIYPQFFKNKEFLPKIICVNCKAKLENEKKVSIFPLIDYDSLIENIKFHTSQASTTVKCSCEYCRIGGVTKINDDKFGCEKSQFLIEEKSHISAPLPKPKISDFFPETKGITKKEKLQEIIKSTDHDSMSQLCSTFLESEAKETSENHLKLKRVHGPPKTVFLSESKSEKSVIDHSTLFKIKCQTHLSGKKILKIAKTLKDSANLKIEENFKEALFEKNHLVDDFFKDEILDLYIYDQNDFQLWKYSDEGHLIDKVYILVEFNVLPLAWKHHLFLQKPLKIFICFQISIIF